MKKYLLATGVVAMALTVSACSSGDSSGSEEASSEETSSNEESNNSSGDENSDEPTEEELEQREQELEEREQELEEQENQDDEQNNSESTQTTDATGQSGEVEQQDIIGEVLENNAGQYVLQSYSDETIEASSGPMEVTISNVEVIDYAFNQQTIQTYGYPAESTVVRMDVEATNTSSDTISFFPNQGTLTTNNGIQVEADMMQSTNFGTEFVGEVTKTGNVVFVLGEVVSEEIESVRYLVDAPFNSEDISSSTNVEGIDEEIEVTQ